jgi:hypothetical protein
MFAVKMQMGGKEKYRSHLGYAKGKQLKTQLSQYNEMG